MMPQERYPIGELTSSKKQLYPWERQRELDLERQQQFSKA